ncbi:MAG: hypothetical protein EG825_12430 [Rhodocyclaceae bacterium]|nr:hypothetical protein [Rhodocyclaceae bacterium]
MGANSTGLQHSDDWPSIKTRSSDLDLYLQAIEEFVPYISAQLLIRQKAKHSTEQCKYPIEELEFETKELRNQIAGPLPSAVLGSTLVVMYSIFETTALGYAESLVREINCLPFNPKTERGEFIPKITRYYLEVLDVKLFEDSREAAEFDTLKELRHSFVHKHCSFNMLPKWLRAEIIAKKFLLSHCEVHNGQWLPTSACISAFGQLIRQWERHLFERIIDRVGLDTFL